MARREAPITPLKLPPKVRHLLVFGGSFDPPHFYHTIAPLSVAVRMYQQDAWVLYIPAARSPLKPNGPAAADQHRLAMLKLALDIPGPRSIWTDEIDRAAWHRARGQDSPSYMIDTLRRLRKIVPRRVEMRLLIGSDQVRDFHKWNDPRAIIRLAEPLILAREPVVTASDVASALEHDFWSRAERRAWCSRLAPNFPLNKSSTEVRAAIPGAPRDVRRWDKNPCLRGIITPVAKYIVAHNLYGFRNGPTRPPPPPSRRRPMPVGTLPPIDPSNPTVARLVKSVDRALTRALSAPIPRIREQVVKKGRRRKRSKLD